jgi:NADH-quinone oxidoreductase subunit F
MNPYAVVEGLLIAAHVIGAKAIYIGIKESFNREIDRLRQAIHEIRTAGLISDLDIEISPGPGEYLFGEEKALLNQIETGLPLPREAHYPPYEKGLFATPGSPNPALMHNVETFAHVPSIVRNGADGFRALGTTDTSGTVLYTISGDVKQPGVYECNAGISLRKLIYEVAGGPLGEVKAVLSGFSIRGYCWRRTRHTCRFWLIGRHRLWSRLGWLHRAEQYEKHCSSSAGRGAFSVRRELQSVPGVQAWFENSFTDIRWNV